MKAVRRGSDGFVDTVCWNQHDWGVARDRSRQDGGPVSKTRVLFSAAHDACSMGKPTFGNDRVITGRTQPSAEARSITSHKTRGTG
jgi:hypothetical protein